MTTASSPEVSLASRQVSPPAESLLNSLTHVADRARIGSIRPLQVRASPSRTRPVVDITGTLASKRTRVATRVVVLCSSVQSSSWLWVFHGNPAYQIAAVFVEKGPLDWGQLTLGIPLHRLGVDSLPVGVDVLVDERHQRSTLTSLASLVITARSLRRPPRGFTVHHLGAYK
eukprot:scaffold9750_cov43-Attheya_sp.AAC.2